jgi:hypothetical protein
MIKSSLLTQITWTRKDSMDCDGTSLSIQLEGLTNETIQKAFGKLPKGVSPKTKYSNPIVVFNNIEGEQFPYTIYTYFGTWRIGAIENAKYDVQLAQVLNGIEQESFILN